MLRARFLHLITCHVPSPGIETATSGMLSGRANVGGREGGRWREGGREGGRDHRTKVIGERERGWDKSHTHNQQCENKLNDHVHVLSTVSKATDGPRSRVIIWRRYDKKILQGRQAKYCMV